MPDISIIICTYNPEIRIIKRCLRAVQDLRSDGVNYEVILVENNCTTSLRDNDEVSVILKEIKGLNIIAENKPGLSNARITGVNNSNSPWIVFFDDDNEANRDYLINLSATILKYPNVGIWGPGQVHVDFLDKTSNWVEKNGRYSFQEKKIDKVEYALEETWKSCYPPGSGMCVRRDIFNKYAELYSANNFKTTGRTGTSLVSAEDNQIIYTSILLGFAVGITPDLKLNHLIPASKSNFSYLKKLRFFIRYSIPVAQVEFYPRMLRVYEEQQLSQSALFLLMSKYLVAGILKGKIKDAILDCLLVSGNYTGANLVLKKENPFWLKLFLRINGIKIK